MGTPVIIVVGGGLAGVEAAWHAARTGVKVLLYEMRPSKLTPAHKTGDLAEIVCSNSFGSESRETAPWTLKYEMRLLDSLVLAVAQKHSVPAGRALAVDRAVFSTEITHMIERHPGITLIREEVKQLELAVPTVIATGPLTSQAMTDKIAELTRQNALYFFDAATPIVAADSINMEICFKGSRYDSSGNAGDYINCPMTKEEYISFFQALIEAQRHPLKEFEEEKFFEGCVPIEELAKRGVDTLRYGPMKPVGLVHPVTGRRPYAVVQLRRDDAAGSMYNMVGFQTNLTWQEQKRVFQKIPGLKSAEFLRYGVMHRNTYIKSPLFLEQTLQLKSNQYAFFAGQITGVEGYMESAATGIVSGINAARLSLGLEPLVFPSDTMIGSLIRYITTKDVDTFQPINANFGILPPLDTKTDSRKTKRAMLSARCAGSMSKFIESLDPNVSAEGI